MNKTSRGYDVESTDNRIDLVKASLLKSVETYHSGAPLLIFMDTSPAYLSYLYSITKNTDILVDHFNNAAQK